jgi:eukaryotic-like serine/threonine-protein kinase
MNSPSPQDGGRCRNCGAALDSSRTREVCPGCALESALEGGREVAAGPVAAARESAADRSAADILPAEGARSSGGFTSAATTGQKFGDYELLEEISRGGMGVVFRARQASLDRVVALKMLLFGSLAGAEVVQRFRTEATAAASLQHQNIVAIHEVGFHGGQHFFAMDYVAGRSLAEIVREGPVPARRAASYVKTIAEAIQYAHERGILHRDLKPSNVLIDEHDQPKVTDFGLAKRLEKDTELTLSGQVLGSPNYMAPEQAAAHRGLVGKRSDVYSLGAVLYHLLTGRAPFVAPTVGETLQQVQTADPLSPTVLNPHLPRDLKTVCLKCLEKEPGRRYQTAQELADELGRWLCGEPILARPVSRPEKVWRWCWRNPRVATLMTAAVFIFLLGFAGVAWQAQQASKARDLAQGRLYAAQMKLAHAAIKEGKTGGALAVLRTLQPAPGAPDFRGFDWRYLYRLCLSTPSEVLATNASGFCSVDYSPDGRMVAFGAGDGFVELFDAQTRRRVKRWPAHAGAVDRVAFYPRDNHWLATVSGGDGILKLWDIIREQVLFATNTARGILVHFAFSPGRGFLATRAANARSLDLWKFNAGMPDTTPTLTLKTNLGFFGPAAFAWDEQTLAVCNQIKGGFLPSVALYDLVSGTMTEFPLAHADLIHDVAFSVGGSKLATGGAEERVVLWDVKRRTNLWTLRSDLIGVTSVAFTPDGRSLFASGSDQNIRSWSVEDPTQVRVWPGHSAGVNALAIAPDGLSLASAGDDGTARLWYLQPTEPASGLLPPEEFHTLFRPESLPATERAGLSIFAVAVSPAQGRAVAAENHRLLSCHLGTGTVLANVAVTNVFQGGTPAFGGLTFSPDGRELAVGSDDGRVAFLDAVTLGSLREPIRLHDGQITHIAYALNGSVLVTGGGFGTGIKLTDVASGRVIADFSAIEGFFPIQPVAVSRDGRQLATGSPERRVCVWDIASRQLIASSPQKLGFFLDLAFSPDGKLLAIAGLRGSVFLWDSSGQQPWRQLVGHAGAVSSLAFSPDGLTLASGGTDHTIRLWHPDIDQEVAVLKGHSEWVWCVAFADHGNALLSGSRDGTLRLWQAAPVEQLAMSERPGADRRR